MSKATKAVIAISFVSVIYVVIKAAKLHIQCNKLNDELTDKLSREN